MIDACRFVLEDLLNEINMTLYPGLRLRYDKSISENNFFKPDRFAWHTVELWVLSAVGSLAQLLTYVFAHKLCATLSGLACLLFVLRLSLPRCNFLTLFAAVLIFHALYQVARYGLYYGIIAIILAEPSSSTELSSLAQLLWDLLSVLWSAIHLGISLLLLRDLRKQTTFDRWLAMLQDSS